jgi:membrane protein
VNTARATTETEAATSEETSAKDRAMSAWEWIQNSRLFRVNKRYGTARGALLAGGISFSALFSIFAALALGWTAFTLTLGGNEELRDTVIESVNDAMPGIIQTTGPDGQTTDGLVTPDQLMVSTAFNLGSIIAIVVLLWTASSVMNNLRLSIQAMFGITQPPENFVKGRLVKPIVGFVTLALAVLVTAAASIAVNTLGSQVLDLLGIEGTTGTYLLRGGTLLASFLIDMAVFILLIAFTASVRAPRRDLLTGAAIGALGSGVLRLLGTSAVGSIDDPLLASFAAIGTLLLWVNLLARLMLYVSAYVANPPLPEVADDPDEVRFNERPNYITESVPETKQWPHQSITGVIDVDPDRNPEVVAEREREEREEAEAGTNPGGLIGNVRERRVRKLEKKAAEARAELDADTRAAYLRYGPRDKR